MYGMIDENGGFVKNITYSVEQLTTENLNLEPVFRKATIVSIGENDTSE